MRIMISYQVDTVDEAKEVMAAVENRGKLTTFRVQDDPAKVLSAFDQATEVKVVERKNVTPGVPLIGKIGSGTKDEIMALLKAGTQPAKKFTEHMKLLWSRGEVQFDGVSYFL